MRATNKIVFNTAILYTKMVVTVCISFYTTRVILNALGAGDFGIYNVVGGVIGMLGFMNAAMTASTQRHLSFEMGKKNISGIKKIFANSLVIHFALGLLLVLFFEVAGIYLLDQHLQIDPERLETAKMIFHFVVVSSFISIISVPYDAVVNAHENMVFVAITNILESVIRLAIAVYLTYSGFDKLLVYGFLVMISSILIRVIKRIYCLRSYKECHIKLRREYDFGAIRELTSFAGWNLFGSLCSIGRSQGISIVLNIFYGTVVNAAYGIANQVNGQLAFFSQTMMKTIRPQMMKSEGSGDRERMLKLSIVASKFSFYLFSFFLIPLFIEMPFVLKFWLKNVPENTVLFCRLIITLSLIMQLSMGIMSAIQSIGKVKIYQTIVGSIQLLTLPIGYIFLSFSYPVYSILVVALVLEVVATFFRVYYFNRITGFSIPVFIKEAVIVPILPFLLTVFFNFFIYEVLPYNIFRLLLMLTASSLVYLILVYSIGVNKEERIQINLVFSSIKRRVWSI